MAYNYMRIYLKNLLTIFYSVERRFFISFRWFIKWVVILLVFIIAVCWLSVCVIVVIVVVFGERYFHLKLLSPYKRLSHLLLAWLYDIKAAVELHGILPKSKSYKLTDFHSCKRSFSFVISYISSLMHSFYVRHWLLFYIIYCVISFSIRNLLLSWMFFIAFRCFI